MIDVGVVKNKSNNVKFVYDSGIRLNLVTDYFEVYFPIYSNLGWEIGQDNYDQKIRFLFIFCFKTAKQHGYTNIETKRSCH